MITAVRRPKTADLASQLRGAVTRFHRRLRRERTDTDLTLTQGSALIAVEQAGAITPRALAAAEGVRPPSMTKVITALEERGLLHRAAHPTDGRQVVLSLTPAGIALIEENRRLRDAWLARRLATLTPAERATLRDAAAILDRLAGT
ncbi:MAG TPA: MarR family transcriptional regulator [Cryptosporangiaceae bacterium]|nr:MarR family transcriptional regulator [Cryptosporangiaceae bacterium]